MRHRTTCTHLYAHKGRRTDAHTHIFAYARAYTQHKHVHTYTSMHEHAQRQTRMQAHTREIARMHAYIQTDWPPDSVHVGQAKPKREKNLQDNPKKSTTTCDHSRTPPGLVHVLLAIPFGIIGCVYERKSSIIRFIFQAQ